MVVIQQKHHQVPFKLIRVLIMEVFDRCLFQHLIGDFHLPVRPRMTEFRSAVLNAQMPAELVKRMLLIGALCFVQQV